MKAFTQKHSVLFFLLTIVLLILCIVLIVNSYPRRRNANQFNAGFPTANDARINQRNENNQPRRINQINTEKTDDVQLETTTNSNEESNLNPESSNSQ